MLSPGSAKNNDIITNVQCSGDVTNLITDHLAEFVPKFNRVYQWSPLWVAKVVM